MAAMPTRMLRFCRNCLEVRQTTSQEICRRCDSELLPLLDDNGAISASFLTARGSCCDTGCRNCPYEKSEATPTTAGAGQQKNCRRCGTNFECCSGDCWCEDIHLTAATLKWLQRNYTGCLCPACIAEFAVVRG
jgi:hypothetical protein